MINKILNFIHYQLALAGSDWISIRSLQKHTIKKIRCDLMIRYDYRGRCKFHSSVVMLHFDDVPYERVKQPLNAMRQLKHVKGLTGEPNKQVHDLISATAKIYKITYN